MEQLSSLHQAIQTASADGDLRSRPPLPVIQQLVSALREAVIEKGRTAVSGLIKQYDGYQSYDMQRQLILYLIASIGGIEAFEFLSAIKTMDVVDAVTAEDELLQRIFPLPISQFEADSQNVTEKADFLLRHLRALCRQRTEP